MRYGQISIKKRCDRVRAERKAVVKQDNKEIKAVKVILILLR